MTSTSQRRFACLSSGSSSRHQNQDVIASSQRHQDVMTSPQSRRTLKEDEVDITFREPFILTGYRLPDQPLGYYLSSAFWLHNETINVWTHAVGCLLILARTLVLCRELGWFRDGRTWPVIGFSIGCLISSMFSALAHLLHSKSPRQHYIMFIMDYAGITFYNLSNGIAAMYTCSHPGHFETLKPFFLPAIVVLGWLSFLLCILARLRYTGHYEIERKLLMIAVMGVTTVFTGWPIVGRYVDCWHEEDCSLHSLAHITVVFVFFAIDGILFAAHCPERWFPGRFDLWGHGHQWFHAGTVVTQFLQLHAIHVDLLLLERGHHTKTELATLLLPFPILALLEGLTIWYFFPSIQRKVSVCDVNSNKPK